MSVCLKSSAAASPSFTGHLITMRTKHIIPTNDAAADIISTLPDNVCGHIVSFLPTKEAVATSILSRRWRYVWNSATSLDFDFSDFPRTRRRKLAFVEFVGRAIEFFSSSELRRFRVSLEGYGGHEPLLEDWVGFAVAGEVQELDICLPRGKLFKIPDCIFTCRSLTTLRLQMCDYAYELPSPAALRRLKTLQIKSISLLKGEFFRELFLASMLLKELVIENCRIDVLEIDAPMLERFTLYNCDWVRPIEIKVSAPCLRSFNYIGSAADGHCLENLSSLVEVVLDLSSPSIPYETDEDCQSALIKLVQMVGNEKVLTLSPWCTENLSRAPRLAKSLQAQGENLQKLVILLERKEDCVRAVAPLLMSFTNLEDLLVCILPSQSLRKGSSCDETQQHKVQAKGAMKELKRVKLEYVDESKTGMELVKFLLMNAQALEKMTIVPSKDGLEHVKFRRKVSMLRKASRNAVVEYCMTP